ncbi:hypothetical protein Pyn_33779 [Prunus yedoensis var. nudiflora]|uniref:Uncharacterized protein n=1 Tax=Prunus yedoensis var. nudiflora TaxID=2094558 RepID=A0A314UYF7_PRUYE|nr:hypothetical protein Pyn_33779 [Prunus yedoensis var. nudiflora]
MEAWNKSYKHLLNSLLQIIDKADIIILHPNDIANLYSFISLPLKPTTEEAQEDKEKKMLLVLLNQPKYKLRNVNIEDKQTITQALKKKAKQVFLGTKIGVKCKTNDLM